MFSGSTKLKCVVVLCTFTLFSYLQEPHYGDIPVHGAVESTHKMKEPVVEETSQEPLVHEA